MTSRDWDHMLALMVIQSPALVVALAYTDDEHVRVLIYVLDMKAGQRLWTEVHMFRESVEMSVDHSPS